MPVYDFDNPEEKSSGNYEPIPVGDYTFMIESCEERTSKASQPYWNLMLRVDGGPHTRRVVFESLSWSKNALWRVGEFLRALGIQKQGQATVESYEVCGLRINATVIQELDEYASKKEGRPCYRNRVKTWHRWEAQTGQDATEWVPLQQDANATPASDEIPF